jgi:hypothetical protein
VDPVIRIRNTVQNTDKKTILPARPCLEFCGALVAGEGRAGRPGSRAEERSDTPAAGSTCSGKKIPSKLLFIEKYFFLNIFAK